MTDRLKLIALDADDLAVISAHVQDARVQPADIIWRQAEKRLVIGMNRLDWAQALHGQFVVVGLDGGLHLGKGARLCPQVAQLGVDLQGPAAVASAGG